MSNDEPCNCPQALALIEEVKRLKAIIEDKKFTHEALGGAFMIVIELLFKGSPCPPNK